jgi:hypothetical protein
MYESIMEILEKEFTYKGFIYSEVIRNGKFAIYKYTNPKWLNKKYYFDVIEIRIVPDYTFPNGIFAPEHEAYQKDAAWGDCAWTYTTLEDAQKKFKTLIK